MHTTMIRASITAYSTAVGPLSSARNDVRACLNGRIRSSSCWLIRLRARYVILRRAAGFSPYDEQPGGGGIGPTPPGCLAPAAPSGRAPGRRSAAGLAGLGADVGEGVGGVGAQRRDGGDAHDDDEGQHDGILDRRRAALVLHEADQRLTELTHL